ncbi:hypothetical protein Rhopal_006694-T1 [Rhodotorula paludigena]|uniref:Urea transporter n=1 Tax=Rhodotorula paludigena TaxID=86838 RepID=A0AAV5GX67_9BASI|nr:hypothetical protein Rhopal_006694-T1 [Rhodotorula paludigena]
MSSDTAILSQGVGYAVVLGIGFFFTFLMIGITWIQERYTKFKSSNIAEFASASHSVKLLGPGFAATLLTSTAQGYKNGIAGPYSYAAGATVQILLFAMNAAKIKLNAPKAHTFLEVIRVRWGKAAHIVFMFYALATCLLVSAMLVTGGSATVTDLTGASTPGICMLIPLGVICYVLIGGLRASIVSDYIHTAVLFAIIMVFQYTVFATSDKIGSPTEMYNMLVDAGNRWPVEGNAEGSYLTFRSKSAMIFMVINLIGNMGTVFIDQSYWQRAIASQPSTAVKGYLLGGSAWMGIPLGMAATMGLSAVVLKTDPSYPNYPDGLTSAQVGAGLPAAAAAQVLLQEGGAALLLVLLFLAVTSAASAGMSQLCAVSTVFSYDIFVPYFRPHATERQVLFVDRCAIVAWGLFSGVLGVAFYYAGISMGWLYEFMGVIIGAGVIPVATAIMWHKANKWAAMTGAIGGTSSGIIGWLVCASALNGGVLSIETTFQDYPMLTGNILSFCVSGLITVLGSLIWPENYDWIETRALHAYNEATEETVAPAVNETPSATASTSEVAAEKEKVQAPADALPADIGEGVEVDSPEHIRKTFKIATVLATFGFVALLILIPLPLVGTSYISTLSGFTAYVVITMIWIWWGAFVCVILPLWEYRHSLAEIFGHMWADIRGKRVEA